MTSGNCWLSPFSRSSRDIPENPANVLIRSAPSALAKSFGEIALFDGCPRTAAAIAISDCELLSIDRRHFLPLVREQPDIAIRLIEILCARLRRSSEQYEDIMFLNLRARVAKLLLRLAEEVKGPLPRKVVVTQQEMSQMAGMSRESINKQLRAWAQAKWVRLERGGVLVLRPEALADIVDGEPG